MATSFSGGRSRSTQRESPTMGKQLVNFITCGCESNAPFFVNYKAGRDPTEINKSVNVCVIGVIKPNHEITDFTLNKPLISSSTLLVC